MTKKNQQKKGSATNIVNIEDGILEEQLLDGKLNPLIFLESNHYEKII